MNNFPTNLGCDLEVSLGSKDIEEGFFLFSCQILFVSARFREGISDMTVKKSTEENKDAPLDKDKEGLMPKNGHRSRIALETNKVEDESVDNFVGKSVFLVE